MVLVKKNEKRETMNFYTYLTVFMSGFCHRKDFKYLDKFIFANFLAAISLSGLYHFIRSKLKM